MCCAPDESVNYPSRAPYGYPEGLDWLEQATPAGECLLTITYLPNVDLTKDGLCIGTAAATWCVCAG